MTAGICIVAPPDGEEVDGSTAHGTITPQQRTWLEAVRKLAVGRGLAVDIFRTVPRVSRQKGEEGRRFSVVEPWEADRLYRLLHLGHDAVFQTGKAQVLLNPTGAYESSNVISLARLVRHKVFFAQFDGHTPPPDVLNEYDIWRSEPHCDSHRDSRVLPLHMFSPRGDLDLRSEEGRKAFELVHGSPAQLKDEKSRPWNQTSAWHGTDDLTIAGFTLPTGFHWDVEAARNVSHMSSLTALWRFDKGAYVNVSPNGHIRGGQSKGVTAVKVGEAPRPAPPEAPKRSDRQARREKEAARRRAALKRR